MILEIFTGVSMKVSSYLLLALLAFSAISIDANASTVLGSYSCKQWLDRSDKTSDSDAYAIWIKGYVSGANAMYGEMLDRDLLKGLDKVTVVQWTEVYCQKYPKAMLEESANTFIKLLKKELPF